MMARINNESGRNCAGLQKRDSLSAPHPKQAIGLGRLVESEPPDGERNAELYWRHSIVQEREIKTMLHINEKNHYQMKQDGGGGMGLDLDSIGRASLKSLGRLFQMDLLAKTSFSNESNRIHFTGRAKWLSNILKLHRIDRSEWYKRGRRGLGYLFSRLLYLTVLGVLLHLTVCLVFQYRHDSYKFRRDRVGLINTTQPELFHLRQLETEAQLMEKINETAGILLLLGSGPPKLAFISESLHVAIICFTLICYIMVRLFYKFKRPYYSSFIADRLDYAEETLNCRRIIRQQAGLFLESSMNFADALVDFSEKSIGRRLFHEDWSMRRESAVWCKTGSQGGPLCPESWRRPSSLQQRKQSHQPNDKLASELESLRKRYSIQSRANNADDFNEIVESERKGAQRQTLGLDSNSEFDFEAAHHSKCSSFPCKQLRFMALHDHLMPINRSPPWVLRLLKLYAFLTILIFLFIITVVGIVLRVLLDLSGHQDDQGTGMGHHHHHLIHSMEMSLLFAVNCGLCLFHAPIMMIACYDQILLANQLRALFGKLVSLNSLRFHGDLKHAPKRVWEELEIGVVAPLSGAKEKSMWVATPETQSPSMDSAGQHNIERVTTTGSRAASETPETIDRKSYSAQRRLSKRFLANQPGELLQGLIEEKMNNDLLLVIMHYRLFMVRLTQVKELCQVTCFWLVTLLFSLAIITKLHQPYFMGVSINSFVILFFLITLPGADMCMAPVCYLHRRCLDLYASLNSLLAHATDIANNEQGRNIYDPHLISVIRKELIHQDAIESRLATKCLGISVTYPNLVRIHLYFSIFFLSLLGEEQSAGELETSRSIFSDPFRLF